MTPIINGRSFHQYMMDEADKENSFRPITKEDIPNLVQIGKKNFSEIYPLHEMDILEEELNLSFDDDWWGKPKFFCVDYKNTILGFGGFYHSALDDGMYELTWINTNTNVRSKGIGKFIVQKLINEIKKTNSCKDDLTIILSCRDHLKKFYKRCGFKVMLKKASNKELLMGLSFLHKKM